MLQCRIIDVEDTIEEERMLSKGSKSKNLIMKGCERLGRCYSTWKTGKQDMYVITLATEFMTTCRSDFSGAPRGSKILISVVIMNKTSVGATPRMILLFLQRVRVKAALITTPLACMAAANWPLRETKLAVKEVPYLPQQLEQLRCRSLRKSPSRVRHHGTIHGTRVA